jgi:Fic family protein
MEAYIMNTPKQLTLLSSPPAINYNKHNKLLIDTRTQIAILKGACYGMPNPELLLSPTVLREAIASSEIENIATTLADVLQAQLFSEAEQRPADKEVIRYNQALYNGLHELNSIPLGSRVITTVHDTLIPSQKGYRQIQNQIINTKTQETIYTPPSSIMLPEYISDLEKFIHSDIDIDPVVKTIISHYQFEAIHPFGDGNGRTGRILMVLCLINYELLDLPVLFISGYINSNKSEYYRALRDVTEKADWDLYIHYMLTAFCEQAKDSTDTLLKIKNLHEFLKRKIRTELPKIYSRDLIDIIFSKPIITPTAYAEAMDVTYQTGSTHLKSLEKVGIMSSFKYSRYLFFTNNALLELLNSPLV